MDSTDAQQGQTLSPQIGFHETLNRALSRASRQNQILAFLLIDIDRLQSLKDNENPEQIKILLLEIAKRFSSILRTSDSVTLLDNKDFAILLTDIEHPKLIGAVAEKLLRVFAHPFKRNGQELQLSCSIGIATFPEDGKTLEELQTKAAAALYQAKHQGRNQYQFSQPQRTLEAHEFSKLQNALHHAIQNHEFTLYFQPKMDLKTMHIVGMEALIRWEHPELGILDPLQFIPSAEESGLMMEIGTWALQEACRVNKQWQDQAFKAITVAVNLSPKQFYHPQLIDSVKKILKETNLDPHYLELEIIETTVLHEVNKVRVLLNELKNLGLSLSIDDFGTGHTSLSYLKDFPFDTVKIDQSFIKPLPGDTQSTAITQAIITLAHQFKCKVVAEGVENLEQLQFLAGLGCDVGQGYFIGRPLPEGKMREQLEQFISPAP